MNWERMKEKGERNRNRDRDGTKTQNKQTSKETNTLRGTGKDSYCTVDSKSPVSFSGSPRALCL